MNENNEARRVDDKHPGTPVDWSDAPRFNALGIAETWSVTVEAEGRRVLCISDSHYAGVSEAELDQFQETIRSCAMHLLGFIGANPALAASATSTISPSPAAAGIEGLPRYEMGTQPVCFVPGTYYLAADVERLLGAHAAAPAALTDEQIDALARPFAGMGGVENYRAFARAVLGAHAGVVAAEPIADLAEFMERSIREHADFREDVERLSTADSRTRKALRKEIYDTIDARVRNAVKAALAAPAAQSPVQNAEEVRRAALEESARYITQGNDHVYDNGWVDAANERARCAAAIRALASKEAAAAEAPEYELHQDDMMVAATSGKNAFNEILHYASQYVQDGPVELYKVVRTKIDIPAATPIQRMSAQCEKGVG